MSTISTVLGIVAVAMTILPAASAAKGGSGVPKSRLSRLTRGVNLGAFRYRSDAPINEDLMAKIQAAGFRHVRLPVAPDLLFDPADPSRLKPDGLRRFDALLDGLLAHKLAVIVDMHDPDTRLWNDAASVDQFARFWEALARHLSGRDPEMVFLETANEPQSDTPERWNTFQGKLLAAMRRGAPRNTLVATPNMLIAPGQWDAQKALQTLTPYDDRNVVYTFHYYNPFVFTHQGATWTWDVVRSLHDVPYPSSPEVVKRLLESATETTRPYLETYGREAWNAARVKKDMEPFILWARRNKVTMTCNEFGVLKNVSPTADRARWLTDVRRILDGYGVGWTMWDDGGGFGAFAWRDGAWQADNAALSSIGLKPVKD